ncbi:MAG TPA: hypothetical protein VG711_11775 [Phycisphaerales bacterium]|nr:hypothetical protein [Phycisphaerales bacterium]
MESERRYILTLLSFAAAFAIGVYVLVWPNYRAASSLKSDIAALRGKLDTIGTQTATVEKLAKEISDAQGEMDRRFKIIPESPDVSGLMS